MIFFNALIKAWRISLFFKPRTILLALISLQGELLNIEFAKGCCFGEMWALAVRCNPSVNH